MHVRACSTCALSRLQLTSRISPSRLCAAAAALSCSAYTLWICVRPTSGAAAIWFDSGKCQASRRCSGFLQLSSLTIINTWTALRQLQWLYTYRLRAASASPWVGWAAVASYPSLSLSASVRDAVRPTFWDLDMFPWTFPSDISPGNHCLK